MIPKGLVKAKPKNGIFRTIFRSLGIFHGTDLRQVERKVMTQEQHQHIHCDTEAADIAAPVPDGEGKVPQLSLAPNLRRWLPLQLRLPRCLPLRRILVNGFRTAHLAPCRHTPSL